MTKIVKYPFGAATVETPAYAATIAVAIQNSKTIIRPGQLTGNATINCTVDSEVVAGDKIIMVLSADTSNRTVTFGTGLTGDALVVPASKTSIVEFEHDGVGFKIKTTSPSEAADVQEPDYAATLAVTIAAVKKTILKPGTLTGNMTINLTVDSGIQPGSTILLKVTADGTNRTLTYGTGITGVALTVTASKTFIVELEHDGTGFFVKSSIQVN